MAGDVPQGCNSSRDMTVMAMARDETIVKNAQPRHRECVERSRGNEWQHDAK
jgi:hypothetical protein